jgi:hypothetical protein
MVRIVNVFIKNINMLENSEHYRWLKLNALHDIVNNYQIFFLKLIFRILVKYFKPKSLK